MYKPKLSKVKKPKQMKVKTFDKCVKNLSKNPLYKSNCLSLPKMNDQFKGYKDPSKVGKFRNIEKGNWVTYLRTYPTKREAQVVRDDLKKWHGANHVRVFPSFEGFEVWIND